MNRTDELVLDHQTTPFSSKSKICGCPFSFSFFLFSLFLAKLFSADVIISTNTSRSLAPSSRFENEDWASHRKCSSPREVKKSYQGRTDRKFIGISCKSLQKSTYLEHRWLLRRWRRLTLNVVGACRCVLSPLNPSVVRSFPIFNWIFSLAREVIYPFYLRAKSRIPIERKLN